MYYTVLDLFLCEHYSTHYADFGLHVGKRARVRRARVTQWMWVGVGRAAKSCENKGWRLKKAQ